jgi:putative endonuclease
MHFIYLLISSGIKPNTYVGYTNDLTKRLILHNSGKGAKYTRGRTWTLAYYEIFKSKSLALKKEFVLKKNNKLRKSIKENFLNNL